MGLFEEDFENGGFDKFIDVIFVWGDVDVICKWIDEYFFVGVNYVCI